MRKRLLITAALAAASSALFAQTPAWPPSPDHEQILTSGNIRGASGEGKSEGTLGDPNSKHSKHSFGAQFAEVTWQPETARLRVSRVVTVIDAGHIINPKPDRNQIEGVVVMGVGMALFEETVYDPRFGAPINNNLADYIVATHADSPQIDVTFLDYPDMVLNPLGARGVGEIGLAGIAGSHHQCRLSRHRRARTTNSRSALRIC